MCVGLFHKGIGSSGTILTIGPLNNAHFQQRQSGKLAWLLGASEEEVDDPARRVKFLRQADAKTITDRTKDVRDKEVQTS